MLHPVLATRDQEEAGQGDDQAVSWIDGRKTRDACLPDLRAEAGGLLSKADKDKANAKEEDIAPGHETVTEKRPSQSNRNLEGRSEYSGDGY